MSQKWALSIPKDAARLGDLEKRAFGPKFPKFKRNLMIFEFFGGFPDVVGHEF